MNKFIPEDFNWCVENDFQVYLDPLPMRRYRIAVRRKGITTEGKDYIYKGNVKITSKVMYSEIEFKSISLASDYMPVMYKHLKKKYG